MAVSKRIRTDLALETTERFKEENTEIRGVEIQEDYDEEKDVRTTVVRIVTENLSLIHISGVYELRSVLRQYRKLKFCKGLEDV